jgi:hypothetical protein
MEQKKIEDTKLMGDVEATKVLATNKPTYADKLIESTHKFTPSEIRKYTAKYGETPGQTLNNRGVIAN